MLEAAAIEQFLVTVAVFALLMVTLTLLVHLARRALLPGGQVEIIVNDSRRLRVAAGSKLLDALGDVQILLPSPCGGRGSCGQCRVTVNSGGGEPTLNESSQLSRRDLRRRWRLACQVPVSNELSVRVPDALLDARTWQATVCENRSIATFLTELVLHIEDAQDFKFEAGAYLLLHAPAGSTRFSDFSIDEAYRSEWQRLKLLNLQVERKEALTRAYSLANAPIEPNVVSMVIRIALPPAGAHRNLPPGRVSSYAFGLKTGDRVTVSGPFGTFRARETDRDMIFIGGGAGIGPLRSIILDQLTVKRTNRLLRLFYGARSRRDLCYRDEFDALATRHDNFEWCVALSDPDQDDDWHGPVGFIHNVAATRYLDAQAAPEDAEYYICGPPVMSDAVIAMLEDFGVEQDSILFDDFGQEGYLP